MAKTSYNCSVNSLYLAIEYGWDLTEQNLAALAAYKSKYTPEFVQANRDLLQQTEDLPDFKARKAPNQSQRLDLLDKKEEVLGYYQYLVGYINDTYSDERLKIMKQAAGQANYAKANNNHWQSVKGLLSSAIKFTEEYQAELTTKGFMPLDFLERFKQVRADFNVLYSIWNSDDSISSTTTESKIDANNTLYTVMMGVISDAQKVFRGNKQMLQKFSFAALLAQTQGTTAAGVKGKISSIGTQAAVVRAKLTIVSLDKSVVTNQEGRYDLSPIAAGIYTILIEAEGFEPFILENSEIKIGAMRRLNVELQPVAVAVAAPEMAMA